MSRVFSKRITNTKLALAVNKRCCQCAVSSPGLLLEEEVFMELFPLNCGFTILTARLVTARTDEQTTEGNVKFQRTVVLVGVFSSPPERTPHTCCTVKKGSTSSRKRRQKEPIGEQFCCDAISVGLIMKLYQKSFLKRLKHNVNNSLF